MNMRFFLTITAFSASALAWPLQGESAGFVPRFSFRITVLFSDQAGLYQLIQLTEAFGLNDQQHFAGLTLTSTSRGGVVKQFTFPSDLPSTDTAYRSVLIKTASLSLPLDYFDFVVPDGFLPTEPGGFVGIPDPGGRPGDQLTVAYVNGLPADGHSALRTAGGIDPLGLFQSFNSPAFHTLVDTDPVIEYYNTSLDHYFITASQPDIDALDSGHFPGWKRTGYAFGTWISTYRDPLNEDPPPINAVPVCRLYIPPSEGDSHFFSASADECAAAELQHPEFTLETKQAFLATLPDSQSGICQAKYAPVYRLWNARPDSNHRYTTSRAIRDQMVTRGYVVEGYGADPVAMCVHAANYYGAPPP